MDCVENMLWLGTDNKGRIGETSEEAVTVNPERDNGSCEDDEK